MKTELEKCLAGEVFNGSDKELAAMTLNAKRSLKRLNDADYADVELKKKHLAPTVREGRRKRAYRHRLSL